MIYEYKRGTATVGLATGLRDDANARRVPALVDSRYQLASFAGFRSGTPNEEEVETLLGKTIGDEEFDLACGELRQRLNYGALLETRGSRGMTLFEEGVEPLHIEAVGAH